MAVASGGKAAAGSTGTLSITVGAAAPKGLHTLALKPPVAATVTRSAAIDGAGGVGSAGTFGRFSAARLRRTRLAR